MDWIGWSPGGVKYRAAYAAYKEYEMSFGSWHLRLLCPVSWNMSSKFLDPLVCFSPPVITDEHTQPNYVSDCSSHPVLFVLKLECKMSLKYRSVQNACTNWKARLYPCSIKTREVLGNPSPTPDFPRPERFPEGEARGKSRGSREILRDLPRPWVLHPEGRGVQNQRPRKISRAEGMYFLQPPTEKTKLLQFLYQH